ncbi:TPA: hypothetical protein KDY90_002573 [Vibrio parahaemolyticus]|nr:hypothetical protein [Vibrio parahaemolyticus]
MKKGFQIYQSKPVERVAHQLTDDELKNLCCSANQAMVEIEGQPVMFAYHCPQSEIKPGDWVVDNGDKDIYHCTDETFRERNDV